MRGFKLVKAADVGANNPNEHDLLLEGGNLQTVDLDEATAQEIKTRLLFFKGESFADTREGIPYYQEILVKGLDLNRARAIIRRALLSVPSVVDVQSITFDVDRNARSATVRWTVRTDNNTVVSSEDFEPLIIPRENQE